LAFVIRGGGRMGIMSYIANMIQFTIAGVAATFAGVVGFFFMNIFM